MPRHPGLSTDLPNPPGSTVPGQLLEVPVHGGRVATAFLVLVGEHGGSRAVLEVLAVRCIRDVRDREYQRDVLADVDRGVGVPAAVGGRPDRALAVERARLVVV